MRREYKNTLLYSLNEYLKLAHEKKYLISESDVFAIGFLCGKYDLKKFMYNGALNRKKLERACEEYDKTDAVGINDTIKETFSDLGIITKIND